MKVFLKLESFLGYLQDRQSSALLQQQNQSEMLMKQLQSQMEAEMRMKTELVRHQMQILSEVQSDSDFNEVISRFAGKEIILKITQNVAFKFSNFGLFHQFLSFQK